MPMSIEQKTNAMKEYTKKLIEKQKAYLGLVDEHFKGSIDSTALNKEYDLLRTFLKAAEDLVALSVAEDLVAPSDDKSSKDKASDDKSSKYNGSGSVQYMTARANLDTQIQSLKKILTNNNPQGLKSSKTFLKRITGITDSVKDMAAQYIAEEEHYKGMPKFKGGSPAFQSILKKHRDVLAKEKIDVPVTYQGELNNFLNKTSKGTAEGLSDDSIVIKVLELTSNNAVKKVSTPLTNKLNYVASMFKKTTSSSEDPNITKNKSLAGQISKEISQNSQSSSSLSSSSPPASQREPSSQESILPLSYEPSGMRVPPPPPPKRTPPPVPKKSEATTASQLTEPQKKAAEIQARLDNNADPKHGLNH